MVFKLWMLSAIVILIASCGETNPDPADPAGAHRLFTQSLADRNYPATYSFISTGSREHFREYLRTTREVVNVVRSRYPAPLQQDAIDQLTIPFPHGSFSLVDMETDSSDSAVFAVLCHKMFGDSGASFALAREIAARAKDVVYESADSVTVETWAGERLRYVRESDGIWRTREIFGRHFEHLLRISRSNLDITRVNADLYAQ